MSEISPKAEIDPRAKIGKDCKIFPFVYIEGDVEIGDGCIIFPFVSILNGTRMGKKNKVIVFQTMWKVGRKMLPLANAAMLVPKARTSSLAGSVFMPNL